MIIGVLSLCAPAAQAATADSVPTFPGGADRLTAFVDSMLVYPRQAAMRNIEGVVDVAFIVLTDGTPTSFRIVRQIDPYLEKEALRIARAMPLWIPAEADGQPIEAPATLRVVFRLPDE